MELGTERIDKAVQTVGDLVMAFVEDYADDQKISLMEAAGNIIDSGADLIAVITSHKELVAQLKDWTPQEREASLQKFVDHFELPDKQKEEAIEMLLTGIVNISGFVTIVSEDRGLI